MKKNNETALVWSCLDLLQKFGIFAWRQNSGGGRYPRKGGGEWFVPFASIRKGKPLSGLSDILGIFRGRMLAVECKMPGEVPTAEQQAFLDRVAAEGGLAIVARSVDDVITGLQLELD